MTITRRSLLAGVAVLPAVARAQTSYPTRPIRLIVPYPPGGGVDLTARLLMEPLGAALGQTIVVDNVSGAGGVIGVGKVAQAAPDGYTIGIGQWSHYVLNGAIYSLQYDLLKDFAPVSLVVNGPMLLVAKKSLPAEDLKGLVAWLKANPDKASAGTGGVGTPPHVAGIFFQKMTDTRFQFVPYRGAAPCTNDLLAGTISSTILDVPVLLPHIRSGALKPLAVTSEVRSPLLPELPTIGELNISLSPTDFANDFNGTVLATFLVPVPEPSSFAPLALGLAGAVAASMWVSRRVSAVPTGPGPNSDFEGAEA